MKLRTNKNSIRLRLSQKEVLDFKQLGFIQETLVFSTHDSNPFSYSLIQADHKEISVSFNNNHLRIYIPLETANHWCDSDEVGFDATIPINESQHLYVLVEKDYQCLTPRPHEDETDNFPNPNAAC